MCNPQLGPFEPWRCALRCRHLVLALQQRRHKTIGGIDLHMFELYTPGGDLQIQIIEAIGLHGQRRKVWGAPTMERAI